MDRQTSAVLCFLLLLAGCAGTSIPPQLIPPEVSVRHLSRMTEGMAADHVTGGMPVQLEVTITSRSSEEIVVERIEVQSVGYGAISIPRESRPFDRTIRRDQPEKFALFVAGQAQDTIVGASGPFTVRLTIFYQSPFGRFREVYTRDLNTSRVKEKE